MVNISHRFQSSPYECVYYIFEREQRIESHLLNFFHLNYEYFPVILNTPHFMLNIPEFC